MDFKEKVALITGAATGLGQACALELARGGAHVAVLDKENEETLIQFARALKETGSRVATFSADVRDHGKAARIVNEVRARMGRLDILVNATSSANSDAALADLSETQWDNAQTANVKGAFNYLQAAARVFREQRNGKIVNVAPPQITRSRANLGNTATARGGIVSLTQTAAAELGRYNVNVNAVLPGFVDTAQSVSLPLQLREQAEREAVLARVGEVQDIAYLVTFLCSERARHITGQSITIDGGQSL